MQIETERLSLRPCPADFAELVLTDRDRAAEMLGVTIPDDWPHPGLAEFLPVYIEWLRTVGLARDDVSRVIARCDPDNAPSIRVLEKIGMQVVQHPPGERLRWEIRAV